jgi:type I restriction-modification system DNA methylase subunit
MKSAQAYLRENHADLFLNEAKRNHFNDDMFYGNDMDRTMLRIGAMNMMLHGVDNPNISYRDSLSEHNPDMEKYSLVLANASEVFPLTAKNRVKSTLSGIGPYFFALGFGWATAA